MSSPWKPTNILVFGATGVIGKFLIAELAKAKASSSSFGRVAIFTSQNTVDTKPEAIKNLQASGVEIFTGSLDDHERIKEAPFDTIVNAFGRSAILAQIPLIDLAEQTPTVRRFFASEYGTDVEYDAATSPGEPTHQHKLQVRAHIREHVKRLEYTYLVTGPYADLYLGATKFAPQTGSFDVKARRAVVLYERGKTRPVSLTSMVDVGRLLVAALQRPDVSCNRALKVNSFTATPDEIVAEFERQTGGSTWEVEATPRDELVRLEKKAYEEKNPVAAVFTLRRIWADGQTLYKKRDNEELGVTETETLQGAVKQSIQQQTAA
ncbi:hypothetical protein DV735_g4514, partial [Chaetothyriales sp. CBS 134920]